MPENDTLFGPENNDAEEQKEPLPKVDPGQLAQLEQELIEKMKRKKELEELEHQANVELAAVEHPVSPGGVEQVFFMIAAGIMVLSLPFMHYLLALLLTAFTIAIALVAGLTSSKKTYSIRLNVAVSILGLVFFEFSAIYLHTFEGASGAFWMYQVLAFLFLFCTYFSMRTYRQRILETQ